jgi:serine/threonine-protein kinase
MAEAAEGTVVDDRYRVISRIGTGGMADVFLAEDLQLGRQIALKILHRRFAEDTEFVERFRREASSAAGLSHPNIVSVFDRGEWDGTYYIAMEYLPGRSLKTIVREQGAMTPAAAIDTVIEILRAARFAHQHGVIHRDLKPHNVIVDEEGRVRVTDFGIARAGASDMTQTGSIMGTAQYLSPEQAQGHAVSAGSDIYAVGIVLYELLTGRLPFDGETAVTIALKQVAEPATPPSRLNPAVSPALDAVVLRALAKNPAQRFADADEFIAALEAARLSPATGSTAQFTAPPPGPPTRAEPVFVVPPVEELGPLPPRERGNERWWWLAGALLLVVAAIVLVLLLAHKSQVKVPVLARCEQQAAAQSALQQRGLRSQVITQSTAACPAGQVVAQSPGAGAKVDKGSTVTLTVSSGPGTVPVPDVSGQGRSAAVTTLSQRGFKPTVQTQPSDTVKPDRVIATSPPAGTEVQAGSPLTVIVSSGPAPVSVPDVTGKSQSDAAAQLAAAGLKVGNVTKRQAPGQTPGNVISQNPVGGAMLPKGGAVNLVVAQASQNVAVPSVVGQQALNASNALGAAGLKVQRKGQPVTDPTQDGVVLAQSPPAGQQVKRGSTVTITVGKFTQPTTTTPTTTTPTTTTPTTTTNTTTSTSTTPPPAAPGKP